MNKHPITLSKGLKVAGGIPVPLFKPKTANWLLMIGLHFSGLPNNSFLNRLLHNELISQMRSKRLKELFFMSSRALRHRPGGRVPEGLGFVYISGRDTMIIISGLI